METAAKTKFSTGQRVVDRDGFEGTVINITEWEGSVWYDVRFRSGPAVRYTNDLTAL